jgi:hypothetical protein
MFYLFSTTFDGALFMCRSGTNREGSTLYSKLRPQGELRDEAVGGDPTLSLLVP